MKDLRAFQKSSRNDARKVNETARKVGEKMGLPAGWDVVERMAGTDAARLLKKDWCGFHEISGWIFVGSCQLHAECLGFCQITPG